MNISLKRIERELRFHQVETLKIAILYIATGRYTIFWKDFYISSEKYFLTNCEKHYFVFTDCQESLFGEKSNNNISRIYQKKLGWPYDTLMRFDMFLKIEDKLKQFDYIFFLNANMIFIKHITEEILPEKEGLLGVLHPGYQGKSRETFTYDENPKSLAYIPKTEGQYYFMGSFNGGKSENYLELINELNRNIKTDLSNNIIALWHDESHLNRYFINHNCKILSKIYATPEKRFPGSIKNRKAKIIIRDKSRAKYGGHKWLRGETDKRKFNLLLYTKQLLRLKSK